MLFCHLIVIDFAIIFYIMDIDSLYIQYKFYGKQLGLNGIKQEWYGMAKNPNINLLLIQYLPCIHHLLSIFRNILAPEKMTYCFHIATEKKSPNFFQVKNQFNPLCLALLVSHFSFSE